MFSFSKSCSPFGNKDAKSKYKINITQFYCLKYFLEFCLSLNFYCGMSLSKEDSEDNRNRTIQLSVGNFENKYC